MMRIPVNLPDALRDRVVKEVERRGVAGLPEALVEIVGDYFQMVDDLEEGHILMKPVEVD